MRDDKGRFVPGESGNPAGRPPGSISLMAHIVNVLNETPENERTTMGETLIRRYVKYLLETNDGPGIRDLIDRLDGKAMQRIEMSNELDGEWLEVFRDIHDQAELEAVG